MSTFTENYDLIKPGSEDYYDVQDFNENMDTIDAQLAEAEAKIQTLHAELDAISERIGTPEAGETIFSLLKAGGTSAIKSIQYRMSRALGAYETEDISIDTVIPAKTFVVMERLRDDANALLNLSYTLSENKISVNASFGNPSSYVRLGFWVIEFC